MTMTNQSVDDPERTAVAILERFDLSTYAARTFVALTSLDAATAKEVSSVVDVPRTRVYDAAEELHDRGLVDRQEGTPRRFSAVSPTTASRGFEREFQRRVATLETALDAIEPESSGRRQRGVWTVTGRDAVEDHVVEFLDEATEEIVYACVTGLLTDPVVDALERADERGVTIYLADLSREAQDRLEDVVPGTEQFESLWTFSDTPAGRLLMVDRERTLVSVRTKENTDDARSETAIWGTGEGNSLVVVLKSIFTWQLNDIRSDNRP